MATSFEKLGLEALQAELRRLSLENVELKERISFLEGHQTLSRGMRGETLISGILNGEVTAHTESFDVQLSDGVRLEVKSAKLNATMKGFATRRWAWGKIFGEKGAKDYDYLVLVGIADERYKHLYLDPSTPYVIFVIPKEEVEPLTMKSAGTRAIQLTTNPGKCKSAAGLLFSKYQVSVAQLKERFGL